MESITSLLEQYGEMMEKDIVGVQLGCYSVAILGLTAAIRKVRPFSRFKKPSDIPNHFIKDEKQLTGVVKRIEPNGALLMIEHKPLLSLPSVSSTYLPVKILGVKVSGLGLSWLQAVVAGKEVKFIPIVKDQHCVHCEVLLPNELKKVTVRKTNTSGKNKLASNTLKLFRHKEKQTIDVAEALLKIGFANVEAIPKPIENAKIQSYINSLTAAEIYALRQKQGLKYYVKPTSEALLLLGNKMWAYIQYYRRKLVSLPSFVVT